MSRLANRKSLALLPTEAREAPTPDASIDFRALAPFALAHDDRALPAQPRSVQEPLSDLNFSRALGSSNNAERGILGEANFGADDTIPGDPSTTVTVPVDGSVTGFIDPAGDKDWFALNVVAGESYLLSLRGTGATPLFDPRLVLYDSSGAVVSSDDDGGFEFNSLLTFTASYTGIYYAEAGEPGHGITGEYRIDLRQQGEDVPDTSIVEILPNDVTFAFIDFDDPAPYLTEWDLYGFEAKAGFAYAITIAGGTDYLSDPTNLPAGELDPYLEVYGPDGMFLRSMDDTDPDELEARVSFLAEEGGTYYLALTAWDALKSGRAGLGGYSITVEEIDLATANPLDTIDWGGFVVDTNHIKVYFAPAGEDYDPRTSLGWKDYEIELSMEALGLFGEFADLTFEITEDRGDATFELVTMNSDEFSGQFIIHAGEGYFAINQPGWSPEGLEQGGRGFFTLLHEFGHGFGLAHPHDYYGPSDVIPGVDWPAYMYGIYDLNQGVHTVMSYNSAWWTHPDFDIDAPLVFDSGWAGTPSPLDIALLQQKYGANTAHNKGDDVYTLRTANGPGTFYSAIWDTGGIDEIAHHGSADALIDLTAATLDYSPTGGGVVSFVDGIFGGFTIANGVVIENASGGGGNDVLVGNDAANRLIGNGGDDVLLGGEGPDRLEGGNGRDTASYSNASGGVSASLGSDRGISGAAAGDRYAGIEALEGSKFADTLQGGNRDDSLSGLDGRDHLSGGNGKDELLGGAGDDLLDGGNHDDRLDGGEGSDRLEGGNHRDILLGGDGGDRLDGGNDDDVLNGGAGNDRLDGGNGSDHFLFTDLGGADKIDDFRRGQDRIDLSQLDAIAGTRGRDSFSWVGASAFSGTAGELRAYRQGDDYFLAGDVNGDAIPDFLIETDVLIVRTDIIFA